MYHVLARLILSLLPLLGCAWPWGTKGFCSTYEYNSCVVSNDRNVSSSVHFRHQGDIIFRKAVWRCDANAHYYSAAINVHASGRILVENGSLILCPTVILEGTDVVIFEGGEVSANGTSHYAMGSVWSIGGKDTFQEGASHGGLGGVSGGCTGDDVERRARGFSQVYGDPLAPWQFGKAGRGLGGGRVRIIAKRQLELNGTISAAGEEPKVDVEPGQYVSAGAGGSVWLTCGALKQKEAELVVREAGETGGGDGRREGSVPSATDESDGGNKWNSSMGLYAFAEDMEGKDDVAEEEALESAHETESESTVSPDENLHWQPGGRVIATGGCCELCACGGGGRVLTEIVHMQMHVEPKHVTASGGCWPQAENAACQCGSAGTWVIRRLGSISQSLWRPRRRFFPHISGSSSQKQKKDIPFHEPHLLPRRKASSSDRYLVIYVDNSHAVSLAGTKIEQVTPLAEFPMASDLRLRDAIVAPLEEQPVWSLVGLALLSVQVGSSIRHLGTETFALNFTSQNHGVELGFSSTLEVHDLQIWNAKTIVLQQNAVIAANSAVVHVSQLLDASRGELAGLEVGSGAFQVHAPSLILGSGSVRSLWAAARQDLTVVGGNQLKSPHQRCDQHPTELVDPCAKIADAARKATRHHKPTTSGGKTIVHVPEADYGMLPNVTLDLVLFSAGTVAIEEGAEVHAAAVLLCAQNATVSGLLSARGLGCTPNRGPGSGQAPSAEMVTSAWGRGGKPPRVCGGGGGAHVGDGGDGVYNGTRSVGAQTGGQKYDGWWGDSFGRPEKYPTWSASGGGGLAAGSGGGIVWLQATVIDIHSNGSISASGEDAVPRAEGSQDGSGGGAGGSIILKATSVMGSGTIDVSGGRGGGCTGGGGGGGAFASSVFHAEVAWENFTGEVLANPGLADRSPACRHGHGASSSGSPRGGRPGLPGELLQMHVCRPGRAGIFCAPCPPGTYNPPRRANSSDAKYRACQECNNKPPAADYTAEEWLNASCPYACPAGFPPVEVNPSCEDPVAYWVGSIGGIYGMMLAIVVTLATFGGAVSASDVKKRRRIDKLKALRRAGQARRQGDEVLTLIESVRQSHPLSNLKLAKRRTGSVQGSPPPPGRRLSARIGEAIRRRRTPQSSFNEVMDNQKQKHILNAKDMPYHVTRIYLLGTNARSDPWHLCMRPVQVLDDLIDPFRWEIFAAQVNEKCEERMRWQRLAEGILSWLYLPVANHLCWRLRRYRARQVAAFVWTWSEEVRMNHSFWRYLRDNSGRYCLKFGTDLSVTVAFIDVLDYGREVQDWAMKPQVPAVLAAAGDGTYMAPIQLDISDPFVQTVGTYFGSHAWQQVLMSFNMLSRLLPPNPNEKDIQLLRQKVREVCRRKLPQSDFECGVTIFQYPAKKLSRRKQTKEKAKETPVHEAMLRQESFETFVDLAASGKRPAVESSPRRLSPRQCTGSASWPSESASSDSGRLCGRLALVVTQVQQEEDMMMSRRSSFAAASTRNSAVESLRDPKCGDTLAQVRVGSYGLSSPMGFDEPEPSPRAWDSQSLQGSPDLRPVAMSLDFELDTVQLPPHSVASPSMSAVRTGSADSTPTLGPAKPQRRVSTGGSVGFDVRTPPPRTPGRFWGSPSAQRGRSSVAFFTSWHQAMRERFAQLQEQIQPILRLARAGISQEWQGTQAWVIDWVLSLGRGRRTGRRQHGGLGRQPSLTLRHRKPRGPKKVATLCLSIILLFHTWTFTTQASVLFSIGPSHGVFFLSLLLPPFADIFALVLGMLYVFGADFGPQACMFFSASLWNWLLGFLGRLFSMETWTSAGVLFLLAEYVVVLVTKIQACRVINTLIALDESVPLTIVDSKADYEWVREYVVHQNPSPEQAATPLRSGPDFFASRSRSVEDLEDMDRRESTMSISLRMAAEASFTTMRSPTNSPGLSPSGVTLPILARHRRPGS